MNMLDEEDQEAIEILGDKELELQIANLEIQTLQAQNALGQLKMAKNEQDKAKQAQEQQEMMAQMGGGLPPTPGAQATGASAPTPSPEGRPTELAPQAPGSSTISGPQDPNQGMV